MVFQDKVLKHSPLKGSTMSSASKLLTIFSYYLALAGLMFLWQPSILFELLPIPQAPSWISITGVLLIVLAIYYRQIAILDDAKFHYLTNVTRCFVFIIFIILIFLSRIEPIFILFGGVDALFAILSIITLIKQEKTDENS
jgi:hypothetical protein